MSQQKLQSIMIVVCAIIFLAFGIVIERQRPKIVSRFRSIFEDVPSITESEEEMPPPLPPGRWRRSREECDDSTLTEEQKRAIQQLQSIGYVSGSQQAPDQQSVTIYDKNQAYAGLNLVVSGHAPEAFLMDMEGHEIHRWQYDISRVWPDLNPQEYFGNDSNLHTFWRRAHLFENGDVLAIFDGIGLIKLDKHSKLLWSIRNRAHHDVYVARNGDIYTLTREAHLNEKYNPTEPILEDFIQVLDSEGRERDKVSILEVLENSHLAPILRRLDPAGDILHTNTVELIEDPPGRTHPLKEGTVLISILSLNLVCAVDLEKKSVFWGESDLWYRQHQPTLLANGNLLVFDNMGLQGQSTVLELDPVSRKIQWSYQGTMNAPFFTPTCGSSQRLPNGNTLITESDPGRAFEVTPDKQIVWEYINPYRAGEKNELIATLFEVVRFQQNFPTDWLP